MQVNRTKHYIEFLSGDNNGEFKIRVQKDCSQLQMETADGDSYVDVNYRELKEIRNCINEALDGFDENNK